MTTRNRPWTGAARVRHLAFLLALLLAMPAGAADSAKNPDRDRPAHADRSRATPARPTRSRPPPAHTPARTHTPARVAARIPRPEPAHVRAHIDPHDIPDHRYRRPDPWHVRALPGHPVPRWPGYRGWYTHWWLHPHWRWLHATRAFVTLGFPCTPWEAAWVPPFRPGWVWAPGHWDGPVWIPGHWQPVAAAPTGYVFVPGFWVGGFWVEGFWRAQARRGWRWVDGAYVGDGVYVQGHWAPATGAPAGRVWEPGFWDGEVWVEGFWRPARYPGYTWVSASWGDDGVYRCGYWEPMQARPGYVWIPGWFDGESWQNGYWVTEAVYQTTDTDKWQPQTEAASEPDAGSDEGPALAIPVK